MEGPPDSLSLVELEQRLKSILCVDWSILLKVLTGLNIPAMGLNIPLFVTLFMLVLKLCTGLVECILRRCDLGTSQDIQNTERVSFCARAAVKMNTIIPS